MIEPNTKRKHNPKNSRRDSTSCKEERCGGVYLTGQNPYKNIVAELRSIKKGEIMKKYKIKYLGQGHTVDIIDARSPKEAIMKAIKPEYFIAEEVK